MKPTERLLPGDNADRKPPVGRNIREFHGPFTDLPDEICEQAMRAVASRAADADDAHNLLEHLGLIDPHTPKPSWKRAHKRKAAP